MEGQLLPPLPEMLDDVERTSQTPDLQVPIDPTILDKVATAAPAQPGSADVAGPARKREKRKM